MELTSRRGHIKNPSACGKILTESQPDADTGLLHSQGKAARKVPTESAEWEEKHRGRACTHGRGLPGKGRSLPGKGEGAGADACPGRQRVEPQALSDVQEARLAGRWESRGTDRRWEKPGLNS